MQGHNGHNEYGHFGKQVVSKKREKEKTSLEIVRLTTVRYTYALHYNGNFFSLFSVSLANVLRATILTILHKSRKRTKRCPDVERPILPGRAQERVDRENYREQG